MPLLPKEAVVMDVVLALAPWVVRHVVVQGMDDDMRSVMATVQRQRSSKIPVARRG